MSDTEATSNPGLEPSRKRLKSPETAESQHANETPYDRDLRRQKEVVDRKRKLKQSRSAPSLAEGSHSEQDLAALQSLLDRCENPTFVMLDKAMYHVTRVKRDASAKILSLRGDDVPKYVLETVENQWHSSGMKAAAVGRRVDDEQSTDDTGLVATVRHGAERLIDNDRDGGVVAQGDDGQQAVGDDRCEQAPLHAGRARDMPNILDDFNSTFDAASTFELETTCAAESTDVNPDASSQHEGQRGATSSPAKDAFPSVAGQSLTLTVPVVGKATSVESVEMSESTIQSVVPPVHGQSVIVTRPDCSAPHCPPAQPAEASVVATFTLPESIWSSALISIEESKETKSRNNPYTNVFEVTRGVLFNIILKTEHADLREDDILIVHLQRSHPSYADMPIVGCEAKTHKVNNPFRK